MDNLKTTKTSVLRKDFEHTLNGLSAVEREQLKDSTILITGCGGFLGYYFMRFFEDQQYLTNNPQRRCPNIDKTRNILGYSPTIGVEEGVERFLTFIKENKEGEFKW